MGHRALGIALLMALTIGVPGAARAGPRIPIPKGVPAEIALELLQQIGDYAMELERSFKEDGSHVTFHPPGKAALSYSVPVNVEVTRSESRWYPLSTIQVTQSVRCCCIVSYNLQQIRVENRELVLPDAKVVATYVDPPGARGHWTSQASFFRLRRSASIDALREKLLQEALVEAERHYLHSQHETCEKEWVASVSNRLNALAESRAHGSGDRDKLSWPIIAGVTCAAMFLLGLIVWKSWRHRAVVMQSVGVSSTGFHR